MHAFGVRSSSSQHFTSANPGFLFMPPSFREGVMGQAEPAPLLQPLRGRRCALNQLSYKCQPSPYSRTRPPTRGSWGKLPPCRWGVMGECRGGLRGTLRKSPWPHSAKNKNWATYRCPVSPVTFHMVFLILLRLLLPHNPVQISHHSQFLKW